MISPRTLLPALLAVVALLASAASASASTALTPMGPVPKATPRIVGGGPATKGYPGYAGIVIDLGNGSQELCGGTLVAPTKVLTAAHCTRDEQSQVSFQPSQYTVVLGAPNLGDPSQGGTAHAVAAVAVEPDYDPANQSSDAAVLTLTAPAVEAPIGVITGGEVAQDAAGVVATAIGYGTTSEGGQPSNQLQEVQLPIQADTTCGPAHIAALMICAGPPEGGKDTCQGDSGGPLLVTNSSGVQVTAGIVSFGQGCARPGQYGEYTRLRGSSVGTWLDSQVGTQSGEQYAPARPVGLPIDANHSQVFITTSSRGLRLDSKGRLTLKIRNANAFDVAGTSTLIRSRSTVGRSAKVAVPAGKTRTARFTTTRAFRSSLRRHASLRVALHLRVHSVATGVSGPDTTLALYIKVRHH